ncbi:Magnesium transporter NIPA2 isoform 1 [Schistosoma japonicum]|uniref:Magnesium transporter NIPA2 isoform 1 n=1 Tax=Schistosoma japonicum TaxID=6182 RepID=A0A4Z2DX13_SCHJA|nr:Magnesium transporter NIPA2 isoform 1 [Schistosoma japonicum]
MMHIMSNNSDSLLLLIVKKSSTDFYIGLGLALLSTIFIGTSFIFKKLALHRISRNGFRAGDGSLSYLCEWMWWMGFILMGVGEFANFLAYTFAPAMLVTPLGGLSVLVSALLSVHFLNERLNCIGGFGCCICLLGSTLIVLHAPKEQNLTSLQEMWSKLTDPPFIIYSFFIVLMSIVLICILGPRYGKRNPIIFTLISGSIGSLSVIACKGIGIGLKNAFTIGFVSIFSLWFFWFLLIWLISSITIQMYYLNRALDLFNTGIITSILYVFFTGFVMLASIVLFHELNTLNYIDYIGLIFGLIFTILGIIMMTVLKDFNLSWYNLRRIVSIKMFLIK